MLRYFIEEEFTKARPSCTLSDMNDSFMNRLDEARHIAGVPFVVTSAYRSKQYEIAKGRTGTSSHCLGLAIDIACSSNFNRLAILDALLKVGFRRIGIGKTFIHVDYDSSKNAAIWLY